VDILDPVDTEVVGGVTEVGAAAFAIEEIAASGVSVSFFVKDMSAVPLEYVLYLIF
jgi:hypothetical protein